MKRLIPILTLLLFGCSTNDKYDLFKIKQVDNFKFISLESINDIRTFNSQFWQADSADDDFVFIVKFDFEKGEFSNNSDKGLKLEGLPFLCLRYDCNRRYGQRFYITDEYEVLNDNMELISEEQISELIKANILNYGKDPSLSDDPREAVTELYLEPKHRIDKLEYIFKIIADSYIDIIEAKGVETKWTTEKLLVEFPLVLHLRQNMTPKDLPKAIELQGDDKEIEEFSLDSIN